jgi:GNAT superfamily N-acetyltransferase
MLVVVSVFASVECVAVRARAWREGAHAVVCDVVEPWAHGTVVQATCFPSYYDFNVVGVQDEPGMSVKALMAFADRALAELAHRRMDFDVIEAGERRRAEFEAHGWQTLRLLWMRLDEPWLCERTAGVKEVAYDAVQDMRAAWLLEDAADLDPAGFHKQAREVARLRGARVLAMREGDMLVAFAQLERDGPMAEITHVYVRPQHRGRGLGTALTRAAIALVGDARDVWITANDHGRAKHLYGRLGFRPVWTTMQFTRLPPADGAN